MGRKVMKVKKARPGPGPGHRDQELSRLDGPTLGYFRRVGDTLEQGFQEEEEKGLFVTNVLEEVRGQELELCTNASVSPVLERLLEQCGALELRRFLASVRRCWARLVRHRCGAHVLQTALLRAARLGRERLEEEGEEEEGGSLASLIRELSAEVREHFLECAQHTHASFVLRTVLQVLGGAIPEAGSTKGKASRGLKCSMRMGKVKELDVPDGFLAELRELAKLLEVNVKEFVTHPVAGPVFQVALQVLGRKLPTVSGELCAAVVRYLGSLGQAEGSRESPLLVFLKDKAASHLLENVIQASDKKLLRTLYKCHLRGQLVTLALHPIANFAVQRLISAAPSSQLFSKLFDELCPAVEDILAQGHMGIVTELVAGCVKHKERQGDILTKLYGAFHCDEPASRQLACAPLFISLLTYEVFYGLGEEDLATEFQPSEDQQLESVNYHGSLVAQHLLRFEQPDPVLRSLAAMPPADCVRLACDPVGSHVLDAVFTSSTVTDKQRRRIVRKFTGQFAHLACDRLGSRVLDQFWNAASVQTKRTIAEELAAREDHLSQHPVGHHVARNLALGHFLKHRRKWEEHQEADSKRRKMFAELLAD